jgi:hypothetical protein
MARGTVDAAGLVGEDPVRDPGLLGNDGKAQHQAFSEQLPHRELGKCARTVVEEASSARSVFEGSVGHHSDEPRGSSAMENPKRAGLAFVAAKVSFTSAAEAPPKAMLRAPTPFRFTPLPRTVGIAIERMRPRRLRPKATDGRRGMKSAW